jgi:festuclavine dehydrogenase
LRPTENFSEHQFLRSIRDEEKIDTATGEGKVPFVSAGYIAECAFKALTDERPHDTNHLILGPELFSYNEVFTPFSFFHVQPFGKLGVERVRD